jgi:transcription-repair coupling factor (superfamily II helicase)
MKKLMDYYVDKGILKNSLFDDNEIYDPKTEWFRNQSEGDRDRIMKQANDEWWNKWGKEYYNSYYNNKVGGIEDLQSDIVTFFDTEIRNNINQLQQTTIGNYTERYKSDTRKLMHSKMVNNDKQDKTAGDNEKIKSEYDWKVVNGKWEKVNSDSEISLSDIEVKMEMISERILQGQLEIKVWTDYYNDLKELKEGNKKEKLNEK